MAKITERVLKEFCQTSNAGTLKMYPYGLTVDRKGDSGFIVSRVYRNVSRLPNVERLTPEPLTARETLVFIEGYLVGLVPVELTSEDYQKDLLHKALLRYDGASMCPDWDANRKRDLTLALDKLRTQLLDDEHDMPQSG